MAVVENNREEAAKYEEKIIRCFLYIIWKVLLYESTAVINKWKYVSVLNKIMMMEWLFKWTQAWLAYYVPCLWQTRVSTVEYRLVFFFLHCNHEFDMFFLTFPHSAEKWKVLCFISYLRSMALARLTHVGASPCFNTSHFMPFCIKHCWTVCLPTNQRVYSITNEFTY